MNIQCIDHVALNVHNVGASVEWYREVIGLERRFEHEWGETPAFMATPNGSGIAFFPAPPEPHEWTGTSCAVKIRHIALRVDRASFDAYHKKLSELGMTLTFDDHGPSHSIYFHDPDGHEIELTTYDV